MQEFLFDTPYWFLGLWGVVGAALWISGNGRQKGRLKEAGLGLIALAVALAVLSYFVDTEREKVIKRTRQLVEAVEKQDKTAAGKLLHPEADLSGLKKPEIIERMGTAADQFRIKSIRITSLDVQPSGKDMSAMLSATADMEVGGWGGGVPSTWNLLWEKTEYGWLLRNIRPINVPEGDLRTLTGPLKAD